MKVQGQMAGSGWRSASGQPGGWNCLPVLWSGPGSFWTFPLKALGSISMGQSSGASVVWPPCRVFWQGALQSSCHTDIWWRLGEKGGETCSFQFVEGSWSEFSRPAGWRGTYHHLHISMVDGHWRFGGLLLKSITTFLVMRFIQDKISKNKPLLLLFFQFAAKKKNMGTNFCFKCTTPKYVKMNKLSSPKIRPKATHSEFKVWRGNKLRPRC